MPKVKISEYSATANSNTDVASINIDEGCAPSGINNAIRAVMGHLKDFQSGTSNDPFTVGSTGSLTLSYGTANGVAYLNGSKVLTTGSALTYSGTTFVNSTNSNAGNFIVNRNISAGAAATSYVISDASAAFTAYTAFGSRSSGYTTSGMLQPSSGGMFTVGMTNGLNIMTLDAYPVNFGTQNVLNMTLDTSGNLGIGTSSPFQKLEVIAPCTSFTNPQMLVGNSSSQTTGQQLWLGYNTTAGAGFIQAVYNGTGYKDLIINPNGGNLLVGTTTLPASGGTTGFGVSVDSVRGQISLRASDANQQFLAAFYNSNGNVGAITVSGSSTSLVTSSDYRLKNTITPMIGALEKVALLKPCTYKWNADGSDGQGFIAHELAEVVPDCVSGEKDAVNEDGSIKPQGIDTSFLVATLTAAIQELNAKFEEYKAAHP
jgi:hypothetical protein